MGNQNKEEAEEEDLGNPLKPKKDKDTSGERKTNEETIPEN